MGLPGKPEGIDGTEVERYFLEGRIKEIADYARRTSSTRIGSGSDMKCFTAR